MKLSVSTLGCVDYSLEQALKLVQDYGLDGIEIRGLSGFVQNAEIPEFAEDRIAETAARIKAVTVPAVLDTSIRCDAMEETEEALDEFRNDLRIAVAVGFPYLRVFGNNLKDPDNEAEYEHIAYELRRMSELAAEQGKAMLLETHGDIDRVDRTKRILDKLEGVKGFGILWDISHSDMFYHDDWQDYYDLVMPYTKHVHIKDHIRATGQLVNQGKGDIPARQIADQLVRDGYDGFFSLEWERKWHPELAPIEEALVDYLRVMKG